MRKKNYFQNPRREYFVGIEINKITLIIEEEGARILSQPQPFNMVQVFNSHVAILQVSTPIMGQKSITKFHYLIT